MNVKLKRGYDIEVIPDYKRERDNKITILGNYSKSNYNATSIVSIYGVAPTVRENHGEVTAILIESEK